MVPLSAIRSVARQVGLPADKTALMRRLDGAGARWTIGPASKGRIGRLYDPSTLPVAIRNALIGEVSGPAEDERDTSFSRYEDAPQSLKSEAGRRLRLVERIAAHWATAPASAAIALVAGETGTSADTLKRYWSAVDGRPWGEWLPALVPAYKGRRANPISTDIHGDVHEAWALSWLAMQAFDSSQAGYSPDMHQEATFIALGFVVSKLEEAKSRHNKDYTGVFRAVMDRAEEVK